MLPAFTGEKHRAFRREGGRPAALLVHGFPGTPAEVRPLADALFDAGWTVEGVLLPGFGAEIDALVNPAPDARLLGADDWLATIHTALDRLAHSHRPLLLVGYSMGGALALAAAGMACADGRHAAPDGLALLNPFWRLDTILWQALPLIKQVVRHFRPFTLVKMDFDDPDTRQDIRTFLPGADIDDPQVRAAIRSYVVPTRILDEVRRAGTLGYRWASQVRMPALVLLGSDDTLVTPANTRRVSARLPGPVQVVEVEAEHVLVDPTAPGWPQVRANMLAFAGSLTDSKAWAADDD